MRGVTEAGGRGDRREDEWEGGTEVMEVGG